MIQKKILESKNIIIKSKYLLVAIISIVFVFVYLRNEIEKTSNSIIEMGNILNFQEKLINLNAPFELPLWEEIKHKIIAYNYSFVEVNIEEMKTRIYENGIIKDEFLIQAVGNPSNWGGSPAGIYKMIDKYRSAYSNSVEVYMPFAVHYYGKYFLHGIPYYPGGTRINSRFSGGCVRYSDKNAEKIFNFLNNESIILIVDKNRDNFQYPEINNKDLPEVSAEAFLVADLNSGTVLLEENSHQKMPIASITKLMTAIVVSENVGINKSILVTEEALGYRNSYGNTPEIEDGKRYQLIDLLYLMLTKSSNQSAEILSNFLGKEETIKLMNEKARAINMSNTFFDDTSGFSSDNISTARDLFYLARYLYNGFKPILSITKNEKVSQLQSLRFDLDNLENRNVFVYDSNFMGGKTGFTNASGNTALFIFSFFYQERERIIVINLLNSKGLKKDTQSIYAWLLKNYFSTENN
jgi:hypothetical protein